MSGGAKSKTLPGLTEKQKDFVRYFLQFRNDDGAGTKAYRLAFDAARMAAPTISSAASELLRNPRVAAYLAERQAAADFRCEVTVTQVLDRYWRIATADPNQIITHRRVNCRHCYGVDHAYQWRSDEEWTHACMTEVAAAAKEKRDVDVPSYGGGDGFNPTLSPHAKCPRCFGEGHGDVLIADTGKLDGDVRLLYKGVKVKPNGAIEVLMHDQMAALDRIAQHLGMNNDRMPGAANGNPIAPGVLINAKNVKDATAIYSRFMNGIP